MDELIAVTGGTGFIGRHLCRHLAALGYRVRVLARSPRKARAAAQTGVEWLIGGLDDPAALSALVKDCRAVIHCAGAVRGRRLADFLPANVGSVDNLLAALQRENPGAKLLFMSSLAASEPALSHYANSKFLGEKAALENRFGIAVSVFRPTAVYGPGDRELLPLLRLMQRGLALAPGRPEDRVSVIFVEDLVRAVAAWLEMDSAPRDTYALADAAAGYSWRELAGIAAETLGRPVRVVPVPGYLLSGLAGANVAMAGAFRYAPMLTPGKVRELRHPDWHCESAPFTRISGWQPRISFAEGLRLTLGAG